MQLTSPICADFKYNIFNKYIKCGYNLKAACPNVGLVFILLAFNTLRAKDDYGQRLFAFGYAVLPLFNYIFEGWNAYVMIALFILDNLYKCRYNQNNPKLLSSGFRLLIITICIPFFCDDINHEHIIQLILIVDAFFILIILGDPVIILQILLISIAYDCDSEYMLFAFMFIALRDYIWQNGLLIPEPWELYLCSLSQINTSIFSNNDRNPSKSKKCAIKNFSKKRCNEILGNIHMRMLRDNGAGVGLICDTAEEECSTKKDEADKFFLKILKYAKDSNLTEESMPIIIENLRELGLNGVKKILTEANFLPKNNPFLEIDYNEVEPFDAYLDEIKDTLKKINTITALEKIYDAFYLVCIALSLKRCEANKFFSEILGELVESRENMYVKIYEEAVRTGLLENKEDKSDNIIVIENLRELGLDRVKNILTEADFLPKNNPFLEIDYNEMQPFDAYLDGMELMLKNKNICSITLKEINNLSYLLLCKIYSDPRYVYLFVN